MQEPVAPAARHAERPGRWVAEERWPSPNASRSGGCWLGDGVLAESPTGRARLEIGPTCSAGSTAGVWCADGSHGEARRRPARGRRPRAQLRLGAARRADRAARQRARRSSSWRATGPVAQLAARLCDVAPDGTSLLVTRGVLNLTHRRQPRASGAARAGRARPGASSSWTASPRRCRRGTGCGSRSRPPTGPGCGRRPSRSRSRMHTAAERAGAAGAPAARRRTSELRPFGEPEQAHRRSRTRRSSPVAGGRTAHARLRERPHRARLRLGHGRALPARRVGPQAGYWATTTYSIVPGDPLSAEVRCEAATELGRDGWLTRAEISSGDGRATPSASACARELEAFENGERVRRREWSFETPRELG